MDFLHPHCTLLALYVCLHGAFHLTKAEDLNWKSGSD